MLHIIFRKVYDMTSAEMCLEKEQMIRSKRYLKYSIVCAITILVVLAAYFFGKLNNKSIFWSIPFLYIQILLSPISFLLGALIVNKTIQLRKITRNKNNLAALIISFSVLWLSIFFFGEIFYKFLMTNNLF